MNKNEALEAIRARVMGEFDNEHLLKIGHLTHNEASDIRRILNRINHETPEEKVVRETWGNMDWTLLRKQKRVLADISMNNEVVLKQKHIDTAEGMLNFLDAIMDAAVDDLGYSSKEVFGKVYPKTK